MLTTSWDRIVAAGRNPARDEDVSEQRTRWAAKRGGLSEVEEFAVEEGGNEGRGDDSIAQYFFCKYRRH